MISEYQTGHRKKQKVENMELDIIKENLYVASDNSDDDPWKHFIQLPVEGIRGISQPDSDKDALRHQVKLEPQAVRDEETHDIFDSFKCYICNVFISREYAKEHAESKKHQSYKKLSKKIVENVIKQHNFTMDYNNINAVKKTSYCGPCSEPVLPADKLKHRLSKKHLKSVENETVFNKFLEMYFDTHPDESKVEQMEVSVVLADKEAAAKTDHDEIDCAPLTAGIEQKNSIENSEVTNKTENPQTNLPPNVNENQDEKINKVPTIKTNVPTYVDKELKDFKVYIENITAEYDVNLNLQFQVDDASSLIAIAPNGERLKITADIFHSFNHANAFVYCQLCKVLLNPDCKAEHAATMKHMRYVSVPINNEFCRQINYSWRHCLVRNEMINVDGKKATIIPNDGTNKFIIKTIEIPKEDNPNLKYCDVCEVRVHVNNYLEHLKGKKHILKSTRRNKIISPLTNREKRKIEIDNARVNMNNASVHMNNASVNIDNNGTGKFKHAMDITYFLQYLKDMIAEYNLNYKLPTVDDNYIVIVTPNGNKDKVTLDTFHSYKQVKSCLYCQVCQVSISGDVERHSVSRTHVRHITLPIDDNFARRINKAWNHCLVCNIMVLVGYHHEMTNPAHKIHNLANASKTVQNNIDENLMTFCDVCQRNLLQRDLAAHMNGKPHIKKAKRQIKNEEIKKQNVINETQKPNQSSDFETSLNEMIVKPKLDCNMPSVEGNDIVITTSGGNIERFTADTFHSYKITEHSAFCQVCQVWISSNIKVHSENKKHVTLIMQPIDDNFARFINQTWSHCLVCNMLVPNDYDHASSSQNHNKYKRKTASQIPPNNTRNEAKKPNDKIGKTFCDTCNVFIDTHNFTAHTNGRKHKDNHKTKTRTDNKVKNTTDGLSNVRKNADNIVSTDIDNKNVNNLGSHNTNKDNNVKIVNIETDKQPKTSDSSLKTDVHQSKIGIEKSCVEVNCIMVIAPNGSNVRITEDGFNSYKRVKSFVYCQVCEKWMPNENKVHGTSKSHLKHIMQPIDNEYIRQINPTWRHCLICNEMIPIDSTHEHTGSEITDPNGKAHNDTTKNTMCYPCCEYIYNCSFSTHIQSVKHINKLKKSIGKSISNIHDETRNNITQNIDEIVSPVDVALNKTSDSNNNTPNFNDIANFKLYFKTIKAKFDLKLSTPLVEEHSIVIVSPNGFKEKISVYAYHSYKQTGLSNLCQICQVSMRPGEQGHLLTEAHVGQITKPVDDNFARTINKAWRHCLLCNEMVFTGFDHVTNNPKHDKYNRPTIPQNCDDNVLDHISPNETKTEIINTNVELEMIDTPESVCHEDASVENAVTQKAKANDECNTINEVDASINEMVDDFDNSSAQIEATANVETLNEVDASINEMVDVIYEVLQEVTEETFVKTDTESINYKPDSDLDIPKETPNNKLGRSDTESIEKPQVVVTEKKLDEYCQQMMKINNIHFECLICNVHVNNLDLDVVQHVEGKKHKQALKSLLNENKIRKKSPGWYHCRLCDVDVKDFLLHIHEDLEHVKLKILSEGVDRLKLIRYVYDERPLEEIKRNAYMLIYEDMLLQNKVKRMSKLIFSCQACAVWLTRVNEIDHMFSEEHRQSLELFSLK